MPIDSKQFVRFFFTARDYRTYLTNNGDCLETESLGVDPTTAIVAFTVISCAGLNEPILYGDPTNPDNDHWVSIYGMYTRSYVYCNSDLCRISNSPVYCRYDSQFTFRILPATGNKAGTAVNFGDIIRLQSVATGNIITPNTFPPGRCAYPNSTRDVNDPRGLIQIQLFRGPTDPPDPPGDDSSDSNCDPCCDKDLDAYLDSFLGFCTCEEDSTSTSDSSL